MQGPIARRRTRRLKAGLGLPHADDPASEPSTDCAGLPPGFPRRSDGCGTGGGRQPPPPLPPPSDALGRAAPLATSAEGELVGSEPGPPLDVDAARSHGCENRDRTRLKSVVESITSR